tara:strand:+ start:2625 stop:2927 length:303 start_codon:yes stop_codon:yes gene_type:complete
MALSRYSFVKKINFNNNIIIGTNRINVNIFNAVENGLISYTSYIMSEGERLDILAGKFYNNSTYWWIIAAASGIGWGLQVPPGTFLKIPDNLEEIFRLIS